LSEAVRDMYAVVHGISVPMPAIYTEAAALTCTAGGYITTVAYLPIGVPGRRQMFVMHLTPDGGSLTPGYQGQTSYTLMIGTLPAGTVRILTVLLTWPETLTAEDLPKWESAQGVINAQHATLAEARGLSQPIVRFDYTNVVLDGSRVAVPGSLTGIRAALEADGRTADGYDMVAVVNIDPARSEGGFAVRLEQPFIYMGNYSSSTFRHPMTDSQLQNIANAVYHHEAGHHWGWAHDWSPTCGTEASFRPFITSPALYGWDDTDGDGVPEILDETPYRRRP
jgi:hypothetical protein